MSELLGPTYIFEAGIGRLVSQIDIDPDAMVSQLRDRGLTDEAINDTVFLFTSDAQKLTNEEDSDEVHLTNAVTPSARRVLVYIGSYAIGQRSFPSVIANAITSLKLTEDLAHESEHLRQYEHEELTEERKAAEAHLPYHERSWERKGCDQGDAYMKALQRGERDFLAWVIFRSV